EGVDLLHRLDAHITHGADSSPRATASLTAAATSAVSGDRCQWISGSPASPAKRRMKAMKVISRSLASNAFAMPKARLVGRMWSSSVRSDNLGVARGG